MNKPSTTEHEILNAAKKYIIKNGFSSCNIRAITKECGISVGTLYNYFPSKNALLGETVASIWEEIFQPLSDSSKFEHFIDIVSCMYEAIRNGNSEYPGFFSLHSLSFASDGKKEGLEMMNTCLSDLKKNLLSVLKQDVKVNQQRFCSDFTEEVFIDYIFTLMVSSLLKKEQPDPLYQFIVSFLYSSH